ncbi:MAG: hypothetical protein ACRC06_13485 [Waterburya sp.]
MLFKKILSISTLLILSCGYSQVAQACEAKFTNAAFGSLEKRDIDHLKQKFLSTQGTLKDAVPVYVSDVQGILGFSGEQTKTASNNRVEHRIWIDQENCNRKVKASFNDKELVTIKIYGF